MFIGVFKVYKLHNLHISLHINESHINVFVYLKMSVQGTFKERLQFNLETFLTMIPRSKR
jgi:hypothetical protein